MTIENRPIATHPFDRLYLTNYGFGIIPVPKCGTQTIFKTLNLHADLNYCSTVASQNFPTLVFLREPKQRFKSSILETLFRVRTYRQSGMYFEDIVISDTIYNELSTISCNLERDTPEFLYSYLNIIKTHGYFDAHHAPYEMFIRNINANNYVKFYRIKDFGKFLDTNTPLKIHNLKVGNVRSSSKSSFIKLESVLPYKMIAKGNLLLKLTDCNWYSPKLIIKKKLQEMYMHILRPEVWTSEIDELYMDLFGSNDEIYSQCSTL